MRCLAFYMASLFASTKRHIRLGMEDQKHDSESKAMGVIWIVSNRLGLTLTTWTRASTAVTRSICKCAPILLRFIEARKRFYYTPEYLVANYDHGWWRPRTPDLVVETRYPWVTHTVNVYVCNNFAFSIKGKLLKAAVRQQRPACSSEVVRQLVMTSR